MKIAVNTLMLWLFSMSSGVGCFADKLNYHLYNLTAEAHQVVANDLMKVTLLATHEANRAADAADEVNKQMQWAMSMLKNKEQLNIGIGQYQTSPVYQNSKIVAWRASQQVHIESEQFSFLTEILSDLQQTLKLDGMQFMSKVQTREQTENALVVEALNQFKARARLVATTMGAVNYDVVNLSVNTGGYQPPLPNMRSMAMAGGLKDPIVEGGSSTLTVSVTGEVQLRHE